MENILKNARDLLRKVKYPGSSKDVIALDMVHNMQIEDKTIRFQLIFQKTDDPFIRSIIQKCENILKEKGGFENVRIEKIFSKDLERPASLEKVKHIIAVSSGKGGVGKSTVSANLSIALAKSGYKVGLIDADIFGPSIPKMFGCEDARPDLKTVGERQYIVPVERYDIKLLSIGFFVEPDSATVWRGPLASNALKQIIEQGFWDELDYLLIDLPPGTSDIHLTVVQTIALDGAVVVSTPQAVALADATKGINMFQSEGVNVPVLGLIENMAWFTPEELPENKYYIFGKEGAKKLAEKTGIPLLGQIPIVQSIRECCDNGCPSAYDENSIVGMAFMDVANKLAFIVETNGMTAKRVRISN